MTDGDESTPALPSTLAARMLQSVHDDAGARTSIAMVYSEMGEVQAGAMERVTFNRHLGPAQEATKQAREVTKRARERSFQHYAALGAGALITLLGAWLVPNADRVTVLSVGIPATLGVHALREWLARKTGGAEGVEPTPDP